LQNFIEIKYDYEFRNKNFMTDFDRKEFITKKLAKEITPPKLST